MRNDENDGRALSTRSDSLHEKVVLNPLINASSLKSISVIGAENAAVAVFGE